MNQKARKQLIRNAEHIIAALSGDDREVTLALGALQVFLDNKIGLASDAHLQRRMAVLANEALALDAQRAGETD